MTVMQDDAVSGPSFLKSNATIEEVEAVLKYMKDHRDATKYLQEVER